MAVGDFEYSAELDGERLTIVGKIHPGVPATGPTWDCGGTPGEAAMVDEYRVLKADGSEVPDEDGKILDMFEEKILEKYFDARADWEYEYRRGPC